MIFMFIGADLHSSDVSWFETSKLSLQPVARSVVGGGVPFLWPLDRPIDAAFPLCC